MYKWNRLHSYYSGNIINISFYEQDTVDVARALLGCILVREFHGQILSGIIVETEAYGGNNDPASHAFKGETKRNAPMFGAVGSAYVYFVYGNHFCFNVVARRKNVEAGAVLIRAIEPLNGIEQMKVHRQKQNLKILTNGPGKLCQALQITKEHNFVDLTQPGCMHIVPGQIVDPSRINVTSRIGISKAQEKLWRFAYTI